jgi:ABC-type glycerol-3-phosphate transport system permease component
VSAGTPNELIQRPDPLLPAGVAAGAAAPLPSARRPSLARRLASPTLTYIVLLIGAALLIVPFVFMVSSSLKTEAAVNGGDMSIIPAQPQWQNYPHALAKMQFVPALANTVVITTLCVIGQVISSSLVGFGFARFRFRGRGPMFAIMIATMMLPAQVTMIPVFVLFRSLHWIDTFWPLIVPAWLASPFFVFMFRQFFTQIPEELIEAARIDGASHWTIYWKMMLPLSGPVIAIVAIYTFLGTWNDFMGPLIYLNSPEKRTLALALANFNGQYGVTDANLLMAASCVTMLPCIIIFFAAQRYFIQSIAKTGSKG